MASFNTAMKWLDDGLCVTRPGWLAGSYWKLSKDKFKRIVYSDGTKAGVHMNQLEADDWKIYHNKIITLSDKITTLNDKITTLNAFGINSPPLLAIEDVKEFIKQLKYWSYIDFGKQILTIDYDKFKELVGKELI